MNFGPHIAALIGLSCLWPSNLRPSNLWASDHRLSSHGMIGVLVTLVFTGIARWLRGVTNGGAVAGAVSCFLLYVGGGTAAVLALITVFALTWLATRLGYARKQKLGIAEKREGRDASQVAANLGVAAICAAVCGFEASSQSQAFWLLALCAALSEAAADTVSSEVGQAFGGEAYLITSWKRVPAGTNGAISMTGTLAGIAAASIVSLVCFLGGLLTTRWLAVSVGAAVLGTIADSLLGASLERRRRLNNDSVNFLSTLVAAAASFWLT
jgi:uncharacterized protein (TIGR00297 family)